MLYTPLTRQAMKLCFEAHRDQIDKGGLPYVFHPIHVAEQMQTEETAVVALLHDVVEDTPYTLENLRAMGFPETVVEALSLMTHDSSVPYMAYVQRLKQNPIARAVKLADLRHNSDLTRLPQVDDRALRRVMKYSIAIAILEEPQWDAAGKQFCKRIPLDREGQCFLRVTGTPDEVLAYSLDVKAAEGMRYVFSPSEAEKLHGALNTGVSLPEALADALAVHGCLSLPALLDQAGVIYHRCPV